MERKQRCRTSILINSSRTLCVMDLLFYSKELQDWTVLKDEFSVVLFVDSLLACGTANISWGRVLAMRCLITSYFFSYICFYLFLFLYPILSTRFPCSLYQRGWYFTAWWVSPCVGVSLCIDVRLCRVSSYTWPVGDALVSRGLVSGVWGRAGQCLPRFISCVFVKDVLLCACKFYLRIFCVISYAARLPQVGLALTGFFSMVLYA